MLTIIIAVVLGAGFGKRLPLGPALGWSAALGFLACGAFSALFAQIIMGATFQEAMVGARLAAVIGLVVTPFVAFITDRRLRNNGGK